MLNLCPSLKRRKRSGSWMIGQARKALQRIEMVRKNPLRRVFCCLRESKAGLSTSHSSVTDGMLCQFSDVLAVTPAAGHATYGKAFSDFSTSAMSSRLEFTLRAEDAPVRTQQIAKGLQRAVVLSATPAPAEGLICTSSEAQEALGIKDERAPPGRPRKDLECSEKTRFGGFFCCPRKLGASLLRITEALSDHHPV